MSVLYRRFTLLAAFIAAVGVMTSILIQETRREAHGYPRTIAPVLQPLKLTCDGQTLCLANPPADLPRAGALA
ncbi:MAG: hypothetical protein KDJ80_07220 [Nitratireductor sp.]|nr:hypothetical protein [Nitratireductor sp.]